MKPPAPCAQEEEIVRQRRQVKQALKKIILDPDVRRRELLDHRLKSPERWALEAVDVDSLTQHKARRHKSKSRTVMPLSPSTVDFNMSVGLAKRREGNLEEARDMLHPLAHGGNAQAQHQLAMLYIDAAMDEDMDEGGKLGSGPTSKTYYKKARKLLKKAAEQVSACYRLFACFFVNVPSVLASLCTCICVCL